MSNSKGKPDLILPQSEREKHLVCPFLGSMLIPTQTQAGVQVVKGFNDCVLEHCKFYDDKLSGCLIYHFIIESITKSNLT